MTRQFTYATAGKALSAKQVAAVACLALAFSLNDTIIATKTFPVA